MDTIPTISQDDDATRRADEPVERWDRAALAAGEQIGAERDAHEDPPPGTAETLHQWFGDHDHVVVRSRGTLGPSRLTGFPQELHLDGTPVSELLDDEDLPYYTRVFLPRLLRGQASWPGANETGGTVDGCVATRRGTTIELLFAERVGGREILPRTPEHAPATPAVPSHHKHRKTDGDLELSLDDVLEAAMAQRGGRQ